MELLWVMQRISEIGKNYCPSSWNPYGWNLHIQTSLCFPQDISDKTGNWFFLSLYHVLGCFLGWWSLSLHKNSVNRSYFTDKEMKFRVVIWRGPQWLSSQMKLKIHLFYSTFYSLSITQGNLFHFSIFILWSKR